MKIFFSRKSKTFFCGNTLMLVGSFLVSTSFLNAEAVKVVTSQKGFVKSETFNFLNKRIKAGSIQDLERNWKWGEDNLLKFLERDYSYFSTTMPGTKLEKLLALLKFAEKNSEENKNWGYARSLSKLCRELIDDSAGELLVEYFQNKDLKELVEIRALEKQRSKVNEKDLQMKAEVYKGLCGISVNSNERISEYCNDFISFCSIDEKSEGAKELDDKIYSARDITEAFCNIFDFRLDSVNKMAGKIKSTCKNEYEGNGAFMNGAFMSHRQFMYIITNSLKILKLDLEEEFRKSFTTDFLLAINSLNALLVSETAKNIFTSIVTSYNKGGAIALEKMLSFWVEQNKENAINKIIEKEINKEECNKSIRENLLKQCQDILNSLSTSSNFSKG